MTQQLVVTASGDRPPVDTRSAQWQQRPGLALLIRVIVAGVPLGASIAAGLAASRAFRPEEPVGVLAWLVWTAAASWTVLWAVDRMVRRLLPLQRLLLLCLVFPDRAPSRLRVAARAARHRHPEALLRREPSADPSGNPAAEAARRIVTLLGALAVHDRRTRGHSERVCTYATLLGQRLHLHDRDLSALMWAALIHDIGKLEVPTRLLNKPGRPTVAEWRHLQEHPARGAEIAQPLAAWLGPWFDAIAQHHERHDGTGYPRGLRGDQLCLGARIIAVADAFEVMTAARPYRLAVDRDAARAELARQAGRQFDPAIVREFLAISLPDLRRGMGLTSLLAQFPLLRGWPRLSRRLASAGGQTAATAGVATVAAVLSVSPRPELATATADPPPTATAAGHPAMSGLAPPSPGSLDVDSISARFTGSHTTLATHPSAASSRQAAGNPIAHPPAIQGGVRSRGQGPPVAEAPAKAATSERQPAETQPSPTQTSTTDSADPGQQSQARPPQPEKRTRARTKPAHPDREGRPRSRPADGAHHPH